MPRKIVKTIIDAASGAWRIFEKLRNSGEKVYKGRDRYLISFFNKKEWRRFHSWFELPKKLVSKICLTRSLWDLATAEKKIENWAEMRPASRAKQFFAEMRPAFCVKQWCSEAEMRLHPVSKRDPHFCSEQWWVLCRNETRILCQTVMSSVPKRDPRFVSNSDDFWA